MVNGLFIISIIQILLLIVAQISIFSNIQVFHGFSPIIYIYYILFSPLFKKESYFILISFGIGLIIDFLTGSLGVHALASSTIAYLKPHILKGIAGNITSEFQQFNLGKLNGIQLILYSMIMVVIHHFVFYLVEGFKIKLFLKSTLFSLENAMLSFVFLIIFYSLFRKSSVRSEQTAY